MSEPATTDDTILGGRVRLRQPAKGYRVAIDPVLLAAILPEGFRGRILDLGCGVGAASLCAATRLPDATVVGVERDAWLADLARQNVAANALTEHVEIVTADIRAYTPKTAFDAVLANPPYLEAARANAQSDARKAAATIEDDASLQVWIDIALARLTPDGAFIMIHRADRLDDVRAALQGRVRDVAAFPLWPKAGAAPKRVIVCASLRGALPRLADGLVLHESDGRYTDAAEHVLRHAGGLTT
jgi:tRNA1(Val) A37 N6-methylase TrmN6